MLSFDFFKNVIFGSEDEAKKNTSLAIKRIIAAIILFLIPHIINTTASALEFAGVKGDVQKNEQIKNNNEQLQQKNEIPGSDGPDPE